MIFCENDDIGLMGLILMERTQGKFYHWTVNIKIMDILRSKLEI